MWARPRRGGGGLEDQGNRGGWVGRRRQREVHSGRGRIIGVMSLFCLF